MTIKVGWRTVKFSIYECAVLLVFSPFLFEVVGGLMVSHGILLWEGPAPLYWEAKPNL